MQYIFYNKAADNKQDRCPCVTIAVPHADAEPSSAQPVNCLCNHKIQINDRAIRHSRMKINGLYEMAA